MNLPITLRTSSYYASIWSSDSISYGGPGAINPCQEQGWRLPAHSAILLKAIAEEERPRIEKHVKIIDNE